MLAELQENRAKIFAKRLENCKVLSTLLDKEVENFYYGCPKIQHLPLTGCVLAIPTDTRRIYTVLS